MQISPFQTKIWLEIENPNSDRRHLEFQNFAHGNLCMAKIYQCSKSDANIFIPHRDINENQKSKMAV